MANKRNMINVNGDAVMEYLSNYCDANDTSIGDLGVALHHSIGYIYASCRNGRFPALELEILCKKTGLSMKDATNFAKHSKKVSLTLDEKLDYIIDMLESIIDPDDM